MRRRSFVATFTLPLVATLLLPFGAGLVPVADAAVPEVESAEPNSQLHFVCGMRRCGNRRRIWSAHRKIVFRSDGQGVEFDFVVDVLRDYETGKVLAIEPLSEAEFHRRYPGIRLEPIAWENCAIRPGESSPVTSSS